MALVSKILETTLTAGQTSVSFTDSDIPNSLIRVFASNTDVIPTSRTLIGNTLTVTYDAQTSNMGVALEMQKQGLEIVDNLTSSDTDKALSAKQGKLLDEDIGTVSGDLSDLTTVVNNLDIPENITDLNDVDVSEISNGQVLAWNSTSEKFENVNQSGGSSHTYTTTPQIVGTWTDGRPVYEVVITGLNLAVTNSWSTAFATNLNIDQIINTEYYCETVTNSIAIKIEQTQLFDNGIRIQHSRSITGRTITRLILQYLVPAQS